jgi:hypothetical protein
MLTKPPWILPLDVIPHLKTNWLVTSFCIESPNGEAGTAALTSNITAAVHEHGNVHSETLDRAKNQDYCFGQW